MPNRRSFLRGGAACGGALAASLTTSSAQADTESRRDAGYGYRLPAFPNGSRFLFIARLGVDMPEAKLEFFNRGHSGNRIADLKSRWQKDVIEMKPDLLSVLIGVNDRRVKKGDGGVDFKKWEADYRDVLTRSRAGNADLRIVLIDPFVLQSGWYMTKGGEWKISRAQIDQMRAIIARLAKEFGAVRVPMQAGFDAAAEVSGAEQWIWVRRPPAAAGARADRTSLARRRERPLALRDMGANVLASQPEPRIVAA